jgi:hypothetical protein
LLGIQSWIGYILLLKIRTGFVDEFKDGQEILDS